MIPATLTVACRYNHKWNEFYERRWVQWETINGCVDMYPYDHWGSGDNIPGCFDWRGDGYIWTMTERYTPVCTLKVHVSDALGNPVDGARVIINSPGFPGPWVITGWTTSSGDCQFLLGDSVTHFTGAIQSVVGNISTTTIITNSEPNTTYYWNPMLSGTIAQLKAIPDTLPSNPLDDYRFDYVIEVLNEILYGTNSIDYNTFSDFSHAGNVDCFICDSTNFAAYASGNSFFAFQVVEDISVLDISFTLPIDENWYLVISNEDQVVDKAVAHITVTLLENLEGVTEEFVEYQFNDLQLAPNPAAGQVRFSYRLSKKDRVCLKIYDVQGRLTKTLIDGEQEQGIHRITWDAHTYSSGIYFAWFETKGVKRIEKLVLMQ